MKKWNSVLFCCSIILAVSCRKKDDVDWNQSVSPTVANISGIYALKAASIGNLDVLASCDKDDAFRFNTDRTYRVSDLGITCAASNDDSGRWDLVNATTMKIDDELATIHYFNGTKLIITHQRRIGKVKLTLVKL